MTSAGRSVLEIYGDNYVEAQWFADLSPDLADADLLMLGRRGTHSPAIDDLLRYDRPDIILVRDGDPVLTVEKTREVPTGHNVGQRVARLVRSVEMAVPSIKFFPFDAMKHGDWAGVCNLNARLLRAFEVMTEIHDTPMLAVNWPADENWELLTDGTEDVEMRALVQSFLDAGVPRRWSRAETVLHEMVRDHRRRVDVFPEYANTPKSAPIMKTSELIVSVEASLSREVPELDPLRTCDETLSYIIGMTPAKCRREDPYTGTQFIYDYAWCRTGPRPEQKHRNLVLWFPKIPKAVWFTKNPNDPSRKSCNWYLTANALIFSDGVEVLRVSEP